MTEENTNFIGNVSTIIKFIAMTLAGYLLGLAASYGLNLPIDQATLAQLIGTILLFIFAYIDAKNPNSFKWLHNDTPAPTEQQLVLKEIVLNEEYTNPPEEDGENGC